MNKLLSFTGGMPDFNIDDILWNDDATRLALQEVFRAFGDNYIIQGVTGTTSITAGYIMLDGELLRVDAHTKTSTHFEKVTTYDTGGDATFNDGVARQTWQKNRATITAGSGSLAYASANRIGESISSKLPVKPVVVEIGDWDMNTDDTVTVTHGIADYKKIRSVSAMIRSDADTSNFDLSQMPPSGTVAGGIGSITSTTILLRRVTGGQFDNPSFAATSYNRGWVTIWYEND